MNPISNLSHEELNTLYKAGKISAHANMSSSMHICNSDPRIPTAKKAAHIFWQLTSILIFIGGPISMFFIKWYWGVAILFFSFIVMNATRRSAGEFVIETALENKGFYHDMLARNVLFITER